MRSFNISCKCLFLTMLATVMLQSCEIWEEGLHEATAEVDDTNELILNVNITAGQVVTRADGHEERDKGTDADNFINIDGGDYHVYILDDSDNRVIGQFLPFSTKKTSGGYRLSGKLTYNPTRTTLRLMVMANWKAFGGSYPANNTLINTMLNNLYTDNNNFNFIYPTAQNGEPRTSWFPVGEEESDKQERHGIPMFGLSEKITIPRPVNGFVPELEVNPIPMLRALAKIVVVNAIDNTKEKEKVEVVSCKLTKYNLNGRFIPDGTVNPKWFEDDTQVATPSFPNQTEQGADLLFIPSANNKTFTAYVPEMNVKSLQDKPYIEVEAKVGNETPRKYKIQLGDYNKASHEFMKDSYFNAILRNHRYEFDIMSIFHGIHLDDPADWDGWYEGFNNNEN